MTDDRDENLVTVTLPRWQAEAIADAIREGLGRSPVTRSRFDAGLPSADERWHSVAEIAYHIERHPDAAIRRQDPRHTIQGWGRDGKYGATKPMGKWIFPRSKLPPAYRP